MSWKSVPVRVKPGDEASWAAFAPAATKMPARGAALGGNAIQKQRAHSGGLGAGNVGLERVADEQSLFPPASYFAQGDPVDVRIGLCRARLGGDDDRVESPRQSHLRQHGSQRA